MPFRVMRNGFFISARMLHFPRKSSRKVLLTVLRVVDELEEVSQPTTTVEVVLAIQRISIHPLPSVRWTGPVFVLQELANRIGLARQRAVENQRLIATDEMKAVRGIADSGPVQIEASLL